MSIFSKAIDAMSDLKLEREASHLESVQAEIARRADVREHAEEVAEAEATAARNAVKVAEFQALAVTVAAVAVAEQAALDDAIVALDAFTRRDIALVKLRALHEELARLGAPALPLQLAMFSPESLAIVDRVYSPLGHEVGVAVTVRPLLVYR